jgi:murein DD-endopeptidase MepM/ murein hydrolase activator NlpD
MLKSAPIAALVSMSVLLMQLKKYNILASVTKKPGQLALAFFYGFFFFFSSSLIAQDGGTIGPPLITRLDPISDVVFKQYSDDVLLSNQALWSHKSGAASLAQSLAIYSYIPQKGDDLLRLAKSTILGSYSSIATLNRISHMPHGGFDANEPILLPSMRGIFIPETPVTDLERLIASSRGEDAGVLITITRPSGKMAMRFIPGDDFSPTERAFFLNPGLFRFPLQNWRLSSAFGMRVSPISGRNLYHNGLDLAAPAGTEVYATREGTVSETGESDVYGKYVIINHDDGWTSLYGHLSVIQAAAQARVKTGSLIGKVGSTGLSTGPHLHFELRQNGKAFDPGKLLTGAKT